MTRGDLTSNQLVACLP